MTVPKEIHRILTRPFLLFYDKTLEARKWFWHYMALKAMAAEQQENKLMVGK